MSNKTFNVLSSDSEVIHSEDVDLKIVEVVNVTANLLTNQQIKTSIRIEKMINIDVYENTNHMPIYLGGVYEYRTVKIIPQLKSDQDRFIEDLKVWVKQDIVKKYKNYVSKNNKLKDIFDLTSDELELINKYLRLNKEVVSINSDIENNIKDEELLFKLMTNSSTLQDIEVLKSIVEDNVILQKYEEYIKLKQEYTELLSKYKFR